MHEFALAEAVVAAALEVAQRQGVKTITRLGVSLGELQQIEQEVFAQALTQVIPTADQVLAEACIDLRVQPARFCCRACAEEFGLAQAQGEVDEDEAEAIHFIPELAHIYLHCPRCSSPDFEVIQGRGVWLETVEGTA